MTDEKKGFDMDMRGGEVYYFKVGIETGFWKGQGKLMLDEQDRGAAEVKKLKPLDLDKNQGHDRAGCQQQSNTGVIAKRLDDKASETRPG